MFTRFRDFTRSMLLRGKFVHDVHKKCYLLKIRDFIYNIHGNKQILEIDFAISLTM